jgi:dipeptidyl aminopeptidase/acylaminoacyl peptidase
MRFYPYLIGVLLTALACPAQTPQSGPMQQTQTAQTQTATAEPPPDTDIFVLDWKEMQKDSSHLMPINITHREGYDNQPMFSPDGAEILFTSIGQDGQADIYSYSLKSRSTKRITNTAESEYSPTFMPDKKHISVVRVEKDQTQRLWKFPLAGGDPSLILENIKPVGYHAWFDSSTVVLFILGEPNTLQIAHLATGKADKIADDVGRCIQKIPHQPKISFTLKDGKNWIIQELNLSTHKIAKIVNGVEGSEDYTWTADGNILMANGSKLYRYKPGSGDNSWKEVADVAEYRIGGITRLAVSSNGRLLAVVAAEPAKTQ